MDLDSRIIERVADLVQVLTRWSIVGGTRGLIPRVTSRVTVSRGKDQLRGIDASDGIDDSLVVGQNKRGSHAITGGERR